jgi:hypothetical protein
LSSAKKPQWRIARDYPKHRVMTANWIVPIAIGSVAVVLLMGLANMLRGGSPNTSQTFMRWRVILQFAAIVAIMATLWFKGR